MNRNSNLHRKSLASALPRRGHKPRHASADEARVQVELTCEAPQALSVFLAGDFNHWRERDLALRRDDLGLWKAELWLAPGRYEYRFIVDTEWKDDPHARVRVPNGFGSSNCVMEVKS